MHIGSKASRRESAEVWYTTEPITGVTRATVDELVGLAAVNPRKRVRLCAHHDPNAPLHEMLIVHERGAYVRPHAHHGKCESVHVIAGVADLVVFDDSGAATQVVQLGDFPSGRTFFHRMDAPLMHTLIIRSDAFIFHETTSGPFDRAATRFADWAPEDGDDAGITAFMADLEHTIDLTP